MTNWQYKALEHLLHGINLELLTILYLHVHLIKPDYEECLEMVCIPVACATYVFQCLLDHFDCVWRLCFHPDIKKTWQNPVTSLQGQPFVKFTAHLVMGRKKQHNDMGSVKEYSSCTLTPSISDFTWQMAVIKHIHVGWSNFHKFKLIQEN